MSTKDTVGETQVLIDYLKSEASRVDFHENFPISFLDRLAGVEFEYSAELPDLPREVQSVEKAKQLICGIAGLLAHNNLATATTSDKQRVINKIRRFDEIFTDTDIQRILATKIPDEHLNEIKSKLYSALGIGWELTESEGIRTTFKYEPPGLDKIRLAIAVANILKANGIKINASRNGPFFRTLEAIRKATGFPTSSDKAVREACKSQY